jgi:hypothetical protein
VRKILKTGTFIVGREQKSAAREGRGSMGSFFRKAKKAEGPDLSEKRFTAEITDGAENTESKKGLSGSRGASMGHDITLVQP